MSDPIDAAAWFAGQSFNGREPVPTCEACSGECPSCGRELGGLVVLTSKLQEQNARLAYELGEKVRQLADADRHAEGLKAAVREARETLVEAKRQVLGIANYVELDEEGADENILEACRLIAGDIDRWLSPPLSALPAARVLAPSEEGAQ